MRTVRRVWLVGAVLVGAAAVAMAWPKLAASPTVPFGVLVGVLGLGPGLGAAATASRRGAHPAGGVALLGAGSVLVLAGGLLAARQEFLDLRLAMLSWRILVRSTLALANVGLVAAGAALVLAGTGMLLGRRVWVALSAGLGAAVAVSFAASVAANAFFHVTSRAPLSVDREGLFAAGLLCTVALLLSTGVPLLRRPLAAPPDGQRRMETAEPPDGPGRMTRGRRRGRSVVVSVAVAGLVVASGWWGWQQWGAASVLAEVFPDHGLAACVAAALGQPDGSATVSNHDLDSVLTLSCNGDGAVLTAGRSATPQVRPPAGGHPPIADLTGLDRLPNLATLDLTSNAVRDLAPVHGLLHLSSLRLTHNHITDVTPLAGLPVLSNLGVSDNAVTDLVPLGSVTALRDLGLGRNEIRDVSPLARLTSLVELDLSDNHVEDVAPLAKLSQLRRLTVRGNRIADPAPLTTLPALNRLDIAGNQLHDAASFTAFVSLKELWLGENPIHDLTPLTRLASLTGVDIEGIDPRTRGVDLLRQRGVFVGGLA